MRRFRTGLWGHLDHVPQDTFSSLGFGRLRPLHSGDDAPGCTLTLDDVFQRGLHAHTMLRHHVGYVTEFLLISRRSDDVSFFQILEPMPM